MSNLADLLPMLAQGTVPAAVPARELLIRGITHHGRAFRPSDWSERLAGVLACYRPGWGEAVPHRDQFIGYSPYVRPVTVDGVKCVVVDERLRDLDVRAFSFALNFARDNDLPVTG